MNHLYLRPEQPCDFRAAEELTRDAFWDVFKPGCDEHYLLHIMRTHQDFVSALGYVAEQDGALVGHIAYTRSYIERADGTRIDTITFGPLSVRPDCQKSGVGAALVRHTLALAREMGFSAVLITGWPDYYPRLGFQPAAAFGVTDAEGQSPAHLQAIELQQNALAHAQGILRESPVFFSLDKAAVEAFDATFPPREKHVTDTQIG